MSTCHSPFEPSLQHGLPNVPVQNADVFQLKHLFSVQNRGKLEKDVRRHMVTQYIVNMTNAALHYPGRHVYTCAIYTSHVYDSAVVMH